MSSWLYQPLLPDAAELLSTPPGTTGQIKYWDGASWVAKPMKYWNGSTWTTKPVKYWNGAWVVTNY